MKRLAICAGLTAAAIVLGFGIGAAAAFHFHTTLLAAFGAAEQYLEL